MKRGYAISVVILSPTKTDYDPEVEIETLREEIGRVAASMKGPWDVAQIDIRHVPELQGDKS